VGSAGHVVQFGASEVQNVNTLFFILGWDWYVFHKKHVETRYTEHVFLHVVGPMGHIVRFGASGVQNVNAQFLMLRWDWYGFHKNHVETRYAEHVFLHPVGPGPVVHFGASRV
jgi:hypothetical protein